MNSTRIDEVPTIERAERRQLAATEYERLADQLRSLGGDDWSQPTDCPLWDVRAVAGHCAGMLSDFTSFGSMLRRVRAATREAKRNGGAVIDAMTAQQVRDHADLTPGELVGIVERNGPVAARWRTSAPALLRAMPKKETVGGQKETWRIGYLLDTILTRDPWMHRIDIARATGRDLVAHPRPRRPHRGRRGRRVGSTARTAVRPRAHRASWWAVRRRRGVGRAAHPRRGRVLPDPVGASPRDRPARPAGPVLTPDERTARSERPVRCRAARGG